MEEFLTKLYSYEYFSTYLIIAIVILILLFIIILFFGKKDQKERELEATKKITQLNIDNNEVIADDNSKDKVEDDTIIIPSINEITNNNPVEETVPEPILPAEENNLPLVDETPIEEDTFKIEENIEPVEVPLEQPILPPVEEKPFEFEEFDFSNNETEVINDNKEEVSSPIEISVPEFNFDEIVKNTEEIKEEEKPKPTEIFSSVYVPEKNNNTVEEEEIELPTLKKEVKEEEINVPKLNDYNLNNISGESYDIK